ncbi:zinc-dependent alcohol dehydrogenase family protein [Azomonas macrocytogenes]|uniref:NADPH:quinone reductase-like Zn-dependent oxidoreductase n=1 Tax=Azomonas macrocytogenes TaxID=69962 RepID=A0A839T174_AZOMA|nr:zinc-dependent alcohol dehydrogenase family protein [Azomonas macrocytogenes]MBB3103142.1 NADPH:quinone reductase-like Zn-dependent oxidoreductase [Azomonas macrocytogenes]
MSRMIRFHTFGAADVLCLEQSPTPAPGAGEVLVRTRALGMGWQDTLWRQNLAAEPVRLPAGLGCELAGVVDAVGPEVEDLAPGMPVASFPAFSPNRYPAWGDLVVMPRAGLTRYPEILSPQQAAVHYTPYLSAYFGLIVRAGLRSGQSVLITEAGHCFAPQAVQLAKALGAEVIGSTSKPGSRDFIRAMGADRVILTSEQDLVLEVERHTGGKGVDVILDQCAGPQMKLLGDLAAVRGKLVLCGLHGGNDASFPASAAFRKHLQFFRHCILDFTGHPDLGIEPDRKAVECALWHINELTAQGLLAAPIDRVFPFEEFVEANRYLELCPSRGRVVLELEAQG